MPTYGGRSASWQALNAMIVVDRHEWEKEGVRWLDFDGEKEGEKEPGVEVPEGFARIVNVGRARALEKPYVPGKDWVGHHMEEVYRGSRMRVEWERVYLLAKEMMEL